MWREFLHNFYRIDVHRRLFISFGHDKQTNIVKRSPYNNFFDEFNNVVDILQFTSSVSFLLSGF